MLHKILVAYDGSKGSTKALTVGSYLAQQCAAELHSITIEEQLPQHRAPVVGGELRTDPKATEYSRIEAIRSGSIAHSFGVPLTQHVLKGHPAQSIVEFAQKYRFDLLVVGLTGHSRIFGQNTWGSTSQSLTALAPCSVLVVK